MVGLSDWALVIDQLRIPPCHRTIAGAGTTVRDPGTRPACLGAVHFFFASKLFVLFCGVGFHFITVHCFIHPTRCPLHPVRARRLLFCGACAVVRIVGAVSGKSPKMCQSSCQTLFGVVGTGPFGPIQTRQDRRRTDRLIILLE